MLEKLRQKNRRLIISNRRYRTLCAGLGAFLNRVAFLIVRFSRACVRFMNHHVTHEESDWFTFGLPDLHCKIDGVLKRQRQEYGDYYYFYGQPYQALSILGVYGERSTEERFDAYGLRELIKPTDRVLDIGCNCGFMALYTSFRTGCQADGVDINPYMIEIGNLCAEYLRVDDRVKLTAARIQDYEARAQYSALFSFATHWTDDENYRVPLREHFERCAAYLETDGLLIFETHAADVGNEVFYEAIKTFSDLFTIESKRDTDRGTRHLYLFRRISNGAAV
ncbi:MAG: methyltransferase domain-containing protein [Polynucleobacter sp.]|nr:methyltransferase domain-containing protein [Polynucleobacter sp.]